MAALVRPLNSPYRELFKLSLAWKMSATMILGMCISAYFFNQIHHLGSILVPMTRSTPSMPATSPGAA